MIVPLYRDGNTGSMNYGGQMYLLSSMLLLAPRIALPEGFTPHLQLVLRWIHFIGGITWVGLLYFFVLVNADFLKQLDAATRAKVVTLQLPRALWWFRWASVVTVLAGIWYWMMIVTADAHNAHTKGGGAIGTFFGLWTLAFVIEMGLQSFAGHRHRRRNGLVHDAQRLGHRLANAEEDHPLHRRKRGQLISHAAGNRPAGAHRHARLADELRAVVPHAAHDGRGESLSGVRSVSGTQG